MAGVGDSWGTREELLHPRDKNGRFRSKWKMAEGVVNKILAALAAFNPRTFQSDGQAAQYTFNQAKPGRFGGGQGYARLSADYDAANDALRAGSMDASTQKFVKMMDDSSVTLKDDIIVHRRVGPEAFGLTPETMALDEGGIEDFTGKLVADRGYSSSNIGTPLGTAPIQLTIAVPKGTKAILPARSRNDRQVYLDRDQEIRVTKVDPDGRGGFYVLAVAQPRTPGDTPAPIGGPGAPSDTVAREGQVEQGRQLGLKAMKVPDDAQPAQHGTDAQRQAQGLPPRTPSPQGSVDTGPGGPPPRNEPVVVESLGGQGGTPQVAGPPAAAPEGAGGAPETPIREADFKEAAKALPIPSAGKRRREWNQAYLGVRSGKKDPDDILRELRRDIEVNKRLQADQKSRGDTGDAELEADIKAQEGLADLIGRHHDIDGKTSDEEKELQAGDEEFRRQLAEEQAQEAPDEPDDEPTPTPAKKAAPAKKATPAKKAAPAVKETAPDRPVTLAEAKRRTALDAVQENKISDPSADATYKRIAKGLEDGTMTVPQARKQALDSAKYFHAGATTIGRNGRATPEARGKAHASETAKATSYEKLAEALADSQSVTKTDKYRSSRSAPAKKAVPAKVAPTAVTALDRMTKDELLAKAAREDVHAPKSWSKEKIKAALRGETPAPQARAAKKAAPSVETQADDLNATVIELRKIAAEEGVTDYKNLRKADLQAKIRAHREQQANLSPQDQAIREGLGDVPTPGVAPARSLMSQMTPEERKTARSVGLPDDHPLRQLADALNPDDSEADLAVQIADLHRDDINQLGRELGIKFPTVIPAEDRKAFLVRSFRAYAQSPGAPDSGPVTPVTATPSSILERLSSFENPPTREVAHEMIAPLPKRDLVAIAKELNVPGAQGLTKEKLREWIVAGTVGDRRDSIATRGFRGVRPDQPDTLPGTPSALEKAARTRQGEIDKARGASELLAEIEERRNNGDSDGAIRRSTSALARKLGVPPDLVDRLLDGDAGTLDKATRALGLSPIGVAGGAGTFDPKQHESIGGSIPKGAQVEVVRPGFTWSRPGEGDIQLSKAKVQVVTPPVVDNPVAQKPVVAPDRAADFRLAWHRGGDFKETGSTGRQLDEIRDDIGSGRITPDEGIRRLENEIGFNKDELAQMDADLRGDMGEEQRHLLKQKRDALAKGITTQEKASGFLRTHFKKAPAVTPDEVRLEVEPEVKAAVDAATPDQIRDAAKLQGITVKGDTKDELLQDLVRKLAGKELERKAATKKPAPKAPDKPKPNLEESPYQRIDTQALAEGLDLRTELDQKMLASVQALLDGKDDRLGKNPTPAQVGRDLEGKANGPGSPFYQAILARQVGRDKRLSETDAEYVDRIAKQDAEADAHAAQGKEWLKLADRLKNTRRRKKQDPVPDVTPTVSKEEKKQIADVAEVTGVPVEQLESKALAKKKAEAPPKQSAVQVAETLKTISDTDEARTLLKGRTKPELVDILKAAGSDPRDGSRATKESLISDIVGTVSIRNAMAGTHARSVPSSGSPTKAQLEDMSNVDLVDLEDELGIKRTSLLRSDRIDAILAKQQAGGAPDVTPEVSPDTPAPAALEVSSISPLEPGYTLQVLPAMHGRGRYNVKAVYPGGREAHVIQDLTQDEARIERDRLDAAGPDVVNAEYAKNRKTVSDRNAIRMGQDEIERKRSVRRQQLQSNSLPGLREMLEAQGLDATGTKPQLVKRLLDAEIPDVAPSTSPAAPTPPAPVKAAPALTSKTLSRAGQEAGITRPTVMFHNASVDVDMASGRFRSGENPKKIATWLRQRAAQVAKIPLADGDRSSVGYDKDSLKAQRASSVKYMRELATMLDRIPAAKKAVPAKITPAKAAPTKPGLRPAGAAVRKIYDVPADDRGLTLVRDRPGNDEPVHLPNGGRDQGAMHFDSEIGNLWKDLYMDDREPNSFVNKIAAAGEDLGTQKGDMETDILPRLRELMKSASDQAVADRIQQTIDKLSAPPAGDLDLPEGIPAPLREYLENLAKIPTARMKRLPGTGGVRRDQSVLDRKLEIVRRLARGERERRDLDILTQRDLHEGTDGAVTMWKLGEKLEVGQTSLEIRRWLRSLDKKE